MRRFVAGRELRFLVVGTVNTAVGYGSFALLHELLFDEVRFGYMVSLVLSYALAITSAFVLYRRYVFRVTGRVLRDLVAFVGVYLVSIGVNLALLPVLVELAGVPVLLAQAVVLAITVVVSFVGHKEVSFKR